MYLKQEKSPRY